MQEDPDKIKKQIELIHYLATRLPWVVVAAVLFTALYYVLCAYFHCN